MKIRLVTSSLLALSLAACGGGGGDDDGSDAPGDPDGGGGGGDETDAAPDADGFAPILTVDWTLPPPEGPTPDKYWCATRTLTQDTIITGFRSISPGGTHHTVLSVGSAADADNAGYECGVLSNHSNLLFASGVGSDDFVFPEGVGLPVQAGQQLFINVHLFNATDGEISGKSGVSVTTADEIDIEAEFTFAGTAQILIPEDAPPTHEESGTCEMAADATILNWWPHMHQLGRNMKIDLDGEEVFNEPFNFLEQKNYPVELEVQAGQQVEVTCTFEGNPDQDVTWGDSSNEEMCFAGFYRYPKTGESFCGLGF